MVPWKNGLGFTTELFIDPPGADFTREAFSVRFSSAAIASKESTFSLFPGYHRVLVVLDGSIRLRHNDDNDWTVLPPLHPHHFDGGVATRCELTDAAVTDFNIMSPDSDWTATVISGPQTAHFAKGDFVFVVSGGVDEIKERQLGRAKQELELQIQAGTTVILATRGK